MKKRICEICGKTKNNVIKKHETKKLICDQCDRQIKKKIANCAGCGKFKTIQWGGKCHACYKAERRRILHPDKIIKKPPLDKDELADYLSKNNSAQIKEVAAKFSRSIDTIRKYVREYKMHKFTNILHSLKTQRVCKSSENHTE